MGSRKLVRIPEVKEDWCIALQKNSIETCRDVLMHNSIELMNMLHSFNAAKQILCIASKSVIPSSCSALNLHQMTHGQNFLPTLIEGLDNVLCGGLHNGTITEISGPPGCGKTQLCMSISATTALRECGDRDHGDGGAIVYLDTENAFSASRLSEIIKNKMNSANELDLPQQDIFSRVIVFSSSTFKALNQRLKELEELIIRRKVKLIVLDSMASIVRKELADRNLINERNEMLLQQSSLLKYYAQTFNLAVVVTNQIASHSSEEVGGEIVPALGNTWSHVVNTRLLVQHLDSVTREVSVAKSPMVPPSKTWFRIGSGGVINVTPE